MPLCTHDGAPLVGGIVHGDEVICPRHGARFCIMTGQALSAPAYEPVPTFPVHVTSRSMTSAGIDGPRHTLFLGRSNNRSDYMRGLFSGSTDRLGSQAKSPLSRAGTTSRSAASGAVVSARR